MPVLLLLLQAFVKELHDSKQYWVPIVDPGIKVDTGYPAYDQGLAAHAFITDCTGQPYLGQVGPHKHTYVTSRNLQRTQELHTLPGH